MPNIIRPPMTYLFGFKLLKMSSTRSESKAYKIATHAGVFHADEALACFMLKQLPEYQNATIIRTRDPEVYSKCDVVVDVGGVYDPTTFRFDHHQRMFSETLNSIQNDKPWTIKLSSAGLVYCHFGRRFIAHILGIDLRENAKIIELIYDKVYENLILEIDAIDNGVSQSDRPLVYQVNTGLSNRVKRLNPRWNDEDKSTDTRFLDAVQLTGSELVDKIRFYQESWLPARIIVEKAVLDRYKIDNSGEIITFEVGGCPWNDHLFTIEAELELQPNIKFALYQDDNGTWRVQAAPVALSSFVSRVPLPESWRGLVTDKLSEASGIPGCVFAHHSGFIGGNTTFEGALEMARKTLAEARVRAESEQNPKTEIDSFSTPKDTTACVG